MILLARRADACHHLTRVACTSISLLESTAQPHSNLGRRDFRASRPCPPTRYEPRVGCPSARSCTWLPFSCTQPRSPRLARHRQPQQEMGDLRSRVLLASTRRLQKDDYSNAESRVLGGEVRSKPTTRRAGAERTTAEGVSGCRRLGMSNRRSQSSEKASSSACEASVMSSFSLTSGIPLTRSFGFRF